MGYFPDNLKNELSMTALLLHLSTNFLIYQPTFGAKSQFFLLWGTDLRY